MGRTLFAESGISAEGKVLTYGQFKLFYGTDKIELNPDRMGKIISEAEEILAKDIPMVTYSMFSRFYVDGNRSELERAHRTRRHWLFILTLAEYHEGKGRFMNRIADLIWAICEETAWAVPAHFGGLENLRFEEDRIPNIELFTASTVALFALVVYLLKDKLDELNPTLRERIVHLVEVRAVRPYLERTCGWEISERPNNWLTDVYSHVLFATAVLVEDQSVREAVVRKALPGLDRFVAGYPDDGCCDEGAGYWAGAAGSLFDCLEILYDMTGGQVNAFDNEKFRAMGEYVANMHINKTYYVNFSDCYPKFPSDSYMVRRYGERSGSAAMTAFGKYMAKFCDGYMNYAMPYRSLRMLVAATEAPGERTEARTAVWYPGHRVAVFRDSENGAEGLLLAAKGGCNGEAHNHIDVGNFIVYSCGEPVIIDAGTGVYCKEYFGKGRSEFWNIRSSYHSLPSFDGIEQAVGRDFRSTDEVCDLEGKSLSMELKGAYPEEAGIQSYRRSLQLSDGVITVCEDVALDREREIDFHMLLKHKPRELGEGVLEIGEGRSLRYDPKLLTLIVDEVVAPGRAPQLNIKSIWGEDSLWRLIFRVKSNKVSTRFVIE